MTMLGKYDLHEELGRGGFGAVYRATDTTLGREVALKVLHPQLTTDPDFLDKFRKEARTVAQLKSRDIVTIHELGEVDGRVFIAMEYMDGGSLKDKLEKEGALSFEETLKIMRQVCAGLDVAHRKGLVHRDIKPANILFDREGNAVISDFGLAKAVSNSSVSAMSSMGIAGTPAYRAPEIWQGKPPASQATDIYSLGCILSEMLSGQILFDGDTPEQILTQHLINGPSIPAGLSQAMQGNLKKALAKDPDQRFSSTNDLLGAVEGTRQDKKQAQAPEPTQPQPQIVSVKEESQKTIPQPTQSPVENKSNDKRLIISLVAGGLAIALLVWGINALSALSSAPAPTSTTIAAVKPTSTPRPTSVPTQRPTASASPTIISEVDGMTLVYVPAGEFLRGSRENDADAWDDEKPQHTVYLDAYYIDQTEVSNAQYKLCVQAGVCGQPRDTTYYNNINYADHPVVNVDWYDANDYCEWAGRELPFEAQWEKAARGTDGRTYPLGEGIDCNRANYAGCIGRTSPVGSFPASASPYGALDMAGNVWEWVADWYSEDYYRTSPRENPAGPSDGTRRVLRGGSRDFIGGYARSAFRSDGDPGYSYGYLGFRCARLP